MAGAWQVWPGFVSLLKWTTRDHQQLLSIEISSFCCALFCFSWWRQPCDRGCHVVVMLALDMSCPCNWTIVGAASKLAMVAWNFSLNLTPFLSDGGFFFTQSCYVELKSWRCVNDLKPGFSCVFVFSLFVALFSLFFFWLWLCDSKADFFTHSGPQKYFLPCLISRLARFFCLFHHKSNYLRCLLFFYIWHFFMPNIDFSLPTFAALPTKAWFIQWSVATHRFRWVGWWHKAAIVW